VRRSVIASLAALVLAPAAGAWTRLTPNVLPNTVRPAVALSGTTEILAYDDRASTLKVLRRPGGLQTVVSGWPGVFQPALAAGQGNTVFLLVPAQNKDASLDGALVSTSSDAGKTWAPLRQTGSKNSPTVWTNAGAVYAARSRSAGLHFGAVKVASPGSGSVYQLSALALGDGSVDVYANAGSGGPKGAIWAQELLPGLTVDVADGSVRVLDDGFPVPGARIAGGGKSVTTDGQGRASFPGLAAKTTLTVTKSGYGPASTRTP
jgi:hypothetical protein